MVISKEEREAWKSHPVTQEFRQRLAAGEQMTKDDWAREVFIGESAEQCLAQNAKAIGGIEVLRKLGEMIDNYELEEGL